ncbi:sugar lactone lactonase YvrE [Paenibacillus endophyticus]|uniref:Sugar lactone lactonase YvrE n=1 Tax=Paenibacillus endophyticus TaxID=1294268 RepID=A0A7W5CAA7_9BACL|nr:stalk domain-containing protein [Paenibacillus endophyticus]MBB3153922.1 sugar lactone lactonase YvrE [Paenibacillus endophyticus]
MQMKKAMAISMIAAAISASAVTPVFAQTAAAKQSVQINTSSFLVNANPVSIRTVVDGGVTLASVRDMINAIGATLHINSDRTVVVKFGDHTLKFKHASKSITVNGTATPISHPVKEVAYSTFIEPAAFIEALGGSYENNAISTVELLDGAEHAVWVNASQLIVSNSAGEGREDYLVNAATGKYELLLTSEGASELVLSPDGTSVAYSDANGAVFTIDLATKQSKQVSTDNSIKNELQWSNDGASLFFLQGDKSSVIAKVTLADGKVSKVLEDKVDYKANLEVSADGTQFAFYVFKQPKVTADSNQDVELDDVAIDATGTEPQIYFYNAKAADNKPAQLTKDTTDKVFLQLSADGSKVSYVSVSNDEASLGQLVTIDNTGKASTPAFADKDVYQLVQGGSKLYLLTADGSSTNAIYEIDSETGASKLVQTVSDSTSELIVSGSANFAALIDGQLAVWTNGNWKNITN